MSGYWFSPCKMCKHFDVKAYDADLSIKKSSSSIRCKAFPNEIPRPILIGDIDHRHPHTEDNGIQFELQQDRSKLPKGYDEIPQKTLEKLLKNSFLDIEENDKVE